MSTALIFSDDFLKHDTGHHPERRERYTAALNGLTNDSDLWQGLLKMSPRPATDSEILRCHSPEAVDRVLLTANQGHSRLDEDTVTCSHSAEVARLAAGGACIAVDQVMSDAVSSAFVACRPPGHHATSDEAMGFCLFNNAAIAARYAQDKYREIGSVLIVDFDVHHGNGTQDIFYEDPTVFYYSLHQFPWYPGTGRASERGAGAGEGFTLNIPVAAATPREIYMRAFEEGLEHIMRSFAPDLVIISAGFDAHVADPLGHLMLEDADYERMTKRVIEAARTTAHARVVSCLEGGYNLEVLGETIRRHVEAMGS
jgi:acetoin utilization deacetylase AcuC-like enzyme